MHCFRVALIVAVIKLGSAGNSLSCAGKDSTMITAESGDEREDPYCYETWYSSIQDSNRLGRARLGHLEELPSGPGGYKHSDNGCGYVFPRYRPDSSTHSIGTTPTYTRDNFKFVTSWGAYAGSRVGYAASMIYFHCIEMYRIINGQIRSEVQPIPQWMIHCDKEKEDVVIRNIGYHIDVDDPWTAKVMKIRMGKRKASPRYSVRKGWCLLKDQSVSRRVRAKEKSCARLQSIKRNDDSTSTSSDVITVVPYATMDRETHQIHLRLASRTKLQIMTTLDQGANQSDGQRPRRRNDPNQATTSRACEETDSRVQKDKNGTACFSLDIEDGGTPWKVRVEPYETVQICAMNEENDEITIELD